MLKMARYLRTQYDIPPSRIWNFDELRIYASPQDLHSCTLEFSSVRDPMVRKIGNPKEAYTGIVMANGDGSELQICLITKKALPSNRPVHAVTVEKRTWENNSVKVTPVEIQYAVIHGVTVMKAPPDQKAWCSSLMTEAYLKISLFRVEEDSILQVGNYFVIANHSLCYL